MPAPKAKSSFKCTRPGGTYREGRSSGRCPCQSSGRRPVPSVSAWHARHVPRRVRISPPPLNFSPPAIADNGSSWESVTQSQAPDHAFARLPGLSTRPGLCYYRHVYTRRVIQGLRGRSSPPGVGTSRPQPSFSCTAQERKGLHLMYCSPVE